MKRPQSDPDQDKLFSEYENQSFDKIWALLKPYHGSFIGAVTALILFNITSMFLPWMVKLSVDRILPNADIVLFWVLAAVMLIIFLMRCLLRYIAIYTWYYTGIRLLIDLRLKVFTHLQCLSLSFYEKYRTGKLISNVVNDVGLLQLLLNTLTTFGEQMFHMVLITLMLFLINWGPMLYMNYVYAIVMTIIVAIMIYRHHENIGRLKAGTERKIKWMDRKKAVEN